jgi:hypothetical protein
VASTWRWASSTESTEEGRGEKLSRTGGQPGLLTAKQAILLFNCYECHD